MKCTTADTKTVLTELRTGKKISGSRHERFPMRSEQAAAVKKTHAYFHSTWKEDMNAVPHFLWNAKMRFGKTFTTYQLPRFSVKIVLRCWLERGKFIVTLLGKP